MKQHHPAGVFGEDEGLIGRRVAASHHAHDLPHVQRTVAGGALGHASPEELLFTGNAEMAQRRSHRHDHRLGADFAGVAGHHAIVAIAGD